MTRRLPITPKRLRIDPKDACAYNARGAARYDQGEYDKAIADCAEAVRLNAKFAEAYYGRGLALEKKGEKSKAEADFARAKELGYKP